MTTRNLELRGAMDDRVRRGAHPGGARVRGASSSTGSAPAARNCSSARAQRRARLHEGEMLDFLPETREIREGDWQRRARRRPTCSSAGSRSPARPIAR